MSPVSAAFMWVSPTAPSRSRLFHPIMSHNSFGAGFFLECAMLGTRDYSAMLTTPVLFEFINSKLGGVERLAARNMKLCYNASVMLSHAWGTIEYCPPRGLCTCTAMIGCPAILGDTEEHAESLRLTLRRWAPKKAKSEGKDDTRTDGSAKEEIGLYDPYTSTGGIVIQRLVPVVGDRLYMRLSAAVYNTMEEFEVLRDAVLELVKDKESSL